MRAAALAVLALAAAFGPAGEPAPAARQSGMVGTYELAICRACDSASVAAIPHRIHVSLYDEPIFVTGPLAGMEPDAEFPILRRMRTLERENFCFVVPPGYSRGFVGIQDTAVHVWEPLPGDSVRFHLYLSPDAGATVRAAVADGRMSGTVVQWMAPGSRDRRSGLIGRRTGPPDPTVCGLRPSAPR